MPLAIELAAAQAEPGRIGELERAVAADLDVLATTMRDVPPRQRSLRAMFKYAWALLPAEEKRALAGVSVIQHPFSAEAGQEIAECTAMALEGLAEKSLLHAAEPGQYALHEVVRQYALEALEQTARGADATQDRHSAYFLGMLARWEGALTGPAQGQRLAEMEAVVDDVRAAWKWAVATAKMDQLVEAEGALFHFYNRRSHFREGARQFARAAETARVEGECPLALAAFLGREAYFRRRLGEQGAALCLAKESAELTREGTGGNAVEAFALGVLASVKSQRGNHDQARRLLEGALALYQKAGDEAGLAATLNALGTVASHTGAYEQALGYYEACLARQEAVEDREMMAACYNNMGVAYYHLAEPAKTEVLFAQSLAIRAEIGDKQGEAKLRNNLGVIAMKQGKLEEAAAYLEASRAAHTALGVERGVALSLLHLGELALVREEPVRAGKLLKEAMARARATGATTVMLEVVVALGQLAEQTGDAARAVALLSLAATDSQAKAETRAAARAALAEVEARLSAAARRAAREQGARLTLAEVATGKE
jgi:tetratricopeptide (TPR) repeat protein